MPLSIPRRSLRYLIPILLIAYLITTIIKPNPEPDDWVSPISSWYTRTIPHPSPKDTDLSRSNLLFGVSYYAQGGSGFSAALFNPGIAVTARGQVLVLATKDAKGFANLTATFRAETPGEGFEHKGLWLPSAITCRPNTILHVLGWGPGAEKGEDEQEAMMQMGVNNYWKCGPKWAKKHRIPLAVWELLGLATEVPSSWYDDVMKDEEVLGRLKEIEELDVRGTHWSFCTGLCGVRVV